MEDQGDGFAGNEQLTEELEQVFQEEPINKDDDDDDDNESTPEEDEMWVSKTKPKGFLAKLEKAEQRIIGFLYKRSKAFNVLLAEYTKHADPTSQPDCYRTTSPRNPNHVMKHRM